MCIRDSSVCFTHQPITCFLAVKEKEILGFACYEATCKDFFGPIGVREDMRGSGIGAGLLLHALHGMRDLGYAYGIIGGVGPISFYEKTVNAAPVSYTHLDVYKRQFVPSFSRMFASSTRTISVFAEWKLAACVSSACSCSAIAPKHKVHSNKTANSKRCPY